MKFTDGSPGVYVFTRHRDFEGKVIPVPWLSGELGSGVEVAVTGNFDTHRIRDIKTCPVDERKANIRANHMRTPAERQARADKANAKARSEARRTVHESEKDRTYRVSTTPSKHDYDESHSFTDSATGEIYRAYRSRWGLGWVAVPS